MGKVGVVVDERQVVLGGQHRSEQIGDSHGSVAAGASEPRDGGLHRLMLVTEHGWVDFTTGWGATAPTTGTRQ
jgi:hypothetical protein